MKTTVIGKPAVSSVDKLKVLALDAFNSIMGTIDLDNKVALKKLLTEYCIFLGEKHLEITSKEITGLINLYSHKIDDPKKLKYVTNEITRRVSGTESYELSGHFTVVEKDGKPVRRHGAYLRRFTPDAEAFTAKNTLDI